MKLTKKSLLMPVIFILALFVTISLSGCGNTNKDNGTEKKAEVAVEKNLKKSDVYTLEMELTQEQGDQSLTTRIKVAQKPGEYMLEVLKRPENMQNVPMLPKKTIIKGDKIYSLINVGGKDQWFVVQGSGQAEQMMSMNMYKVLDDQLAKVKALETKKEEIKGKKVECYYYTGEQKICVYKDHIVYAEGDMGNGGKVKLTINDYSTKVSDDDFKVDGEVHSIDELMQYMAQTATGNN